MSAKASRHGHVIDLIKSEEADFEWMLGGGPGRHGLTQPLADGGAIAYGWDVGIRTFQGQAMFIHGGGWQGAYAKAIRSPGLGLSVAGFAADDSAGRIVAVTDAIFSSLAAGSPRRTAT